MKGADARLRGVLGRWFGGIGASGPARKLLPFDACRVSRLRWKKRALGHEGQGSRPAVASHVR